MKLDNDTLKHCIFSLLTGLEIQDVDLFMERLSPANCLKLGRAYAQASRGKVVKMGIMAKFKKLFCVKKIPYADNMPLLQIIEEGHKRELVQQKMISDEMFQKELKSAYSRGYGEAQADIFAAIKKEPEQYHEFIEKHRAETTANSEKKFDMEWHPTPEGKSIPPDGGGCKCLLNRFFKDRVWKELHERVVNEEHIGKSGLWSSRDSEIFNSFPFRLLCEKVEELEDKLRGAIDFSIRDGVILSNMTEKREQN